MRNQRVKRICKTCGREFLINPFALAQSKGAGTYCSRKCRTIIKAIPCQNCGKVFKPYTLKHGKFCSRRCYWENLKKGKIIPCSICGNLFYATRPRLNEQGKKYCSNKCHGVDRTGTNIHGRAVHVKKKRRAKKQETTAEYRREYWRSRYYSDPIFKMIHRQRVRIWKVFHRNQIKKPGPTLKLIGCSALDLKQYLESKFKPGMNWENHGYSGWHVDHIKPLASFDFNDELQIREAFHYTNLQPLWAEENLQKHTRSIA